MPLLPAAVPVELVAMSPHSYTGTSIDIPHYIKKYWNVKKDWGDNCSYWPFHFRRKGGRCTFTQSDGWAGVDREVETSLAVGRWLAARVGQSVEGDVDYSG